MSDVLAVPLVGRAGPVPVLGSYRDDAASGHLVIADVAGAGVDALAGDLPHNAARAEAVVARARRAGATVELVPGPHRRVDVVARCRDRGRDSVDIVRAAPELVSDLQLGGWFDAGWRLRAARRVLCRLPVALLRAVAFTRRRAAIALAADAAFWAGVRARATAAEWRRLTHSSYVALCYHRVAGAGVAGEERIDVAPREFARHVAALRRLRCTPLAPSDVAAFHDGELPTLPRRAIVLTADDGFADCVAALRTASPLAPQLFVPTAAPGERAWWVPSSAPVATWDDLVAAAQRGITLGSHGRSHRRLTTLDDAALRDELEGSRDDLVGRIGHLRPLVLAYPNGAHDRRVRRMAADTGFDLAYSTARGRNGAGTDRFALRRITPKAWDSRWSLAWKALTGEPLPARWERRLERRHRRRTDDR